MKNSKELLSKLSDKHLSQQFFKSLELIRSSSKVALRDPEYLISILEQASLSPKLSLHSIELRQHPYASMLSAEELAYALIELSHYKISKLIEIGSGMGGATALITAYLKQFSKEVEVSLYDPKNTIELANSDLCIFNLTDNFEEIENLYKKVAKTTRICMFHHIHHGYHIGNFHLKPEKETAGVIRFWDEVKKKTKDHSHIFEFSFPRGSEVSKGIGVQILETSSLS